MDKGTYKGRRVEFRRYAVSCFNPFLFSDPASELRGCGAGALALLTGVAPEKISAKNGGIHYPDDFMRRFLRQHGFRTLQLTQCNLSSAEDYVGTDHVILLSQLFKRNEATWGVTFGGMYYHNFSLFSMNALSVLNKPVLSAYIVIDPRWRTPPVKKSSLKRVVSRNRLKLKLLMGKSKSSDLISQSQIKE